VVYVFGLRKDNNVKKTLFQPGNYLTISHAGTGYQTV